LAGLYTSREADYKLLLALAGWVTKIRENAR
jgi:hypothetical protein